MLSVSQATEELKKPLSREFSITVLDEFPSYDAFLSLLPDEAHLLI